MWRASCQDPIPHELLDKVKPALSCLGGHLQIPWYIEPSPIVLGEQASMEQTTERFRAIASTLAELSAEGLNAQTVETNLLSMYGGAASQHVLRMSLPPEQEANNFDTEVVAFWSQLIQRTAHLPVVLSASLKLGGLGVGSAVQRHAAAPWRA